MQENEALKVYINDRIVINEKMDNIDAALQIIPKSHFGLYYTEVKYHYYFSNLEYRILLEYKNNKVIDTTFHRNENDLIFGFSLNIKEPKNFPTNKSNNDTSYTNSCKNLREIVVIDKSNKNKFPDL